MKFEFLEEFLLGRYKISRVRDRNPRLHYVDGNHSFHSNPSGVSDQQISSATKLIPFQGIKGVEKKQKIDAMLADIQLMDKRDEQSSTLSGGMKRKLRCNIFSLFKSP